MNYDSTKLDAFRYKGGGRDPYPFAVEQLRTRKITPRTRKIVRYRCGFGYVRPHTIVETAKHFRIDESVVRLAEDIAWDIVNGR